MFKKLISNLPYSPGLVGQMGFYIKRLRQEEFIRRMGMIFTALSIAVQMISVTVPPTHAQASHANNIVYEAVSSKQHMLDVWDNGDTSGNKDIDDIYRFYGIKRADIKNATLKTISSASTFDGWEIWTMGRVKYNQTADEYAQDIPTNEGGTTRVYVRPWARSWGTHDRQVLHGFTSEGREFAVIMNCGNPAIAFPEEEPEVPQPLIGDFRANCKNIAGWAIDPRLPNNRVKVRIDIDGQKVHVLWAEDSDEYIASKNGNHGFKWKIPDGYIDGKVHTVTVIAIEDVSARGVSEGNQVLISSNGKNTINTDCYEPPEVNYLKVCRPGEGIVTVEEDQVRPTDFADLSMCNFITICVDNALVTIEKWQYDGQPLTCPQIQVCRDGVILIIAADTKLPTDLEPGQCQEILICDSNTGQVITIQKKDLKPEDAQPKPDDLGSLTCDEIKPNINLSKQARNDTQNIVYTSTGKAKPGDVIIYELTTANTGNADTTYTVVENIEDIREYANLLDSGGGDYDSDKHILTWANVEVKAGQNVSHVFKVQIKDVLPSTATNPANTNSYDFEMRNVYGNAIEIELPKPVAKKVEQFAGSLPNTGPGENAFFLTLFVGLVFFFYFRNRLVTKELNMLRKDFRGDGDE